MMDALELAQHETSATNKLLTVHLKILGNLSSELRSLLCDLV